MSATATSKGWRAAVLNYRVSSAPARLCLLGYEPRGGGGRGEGGGVAPATSLPWCASAGPRVRGADTQTRERITVERHYMRQRTDVKLCQVSMSLFFT